MKKRKQITRFCAYCGGKIIDALPKQKVCTDCRGKPEAEEELKGLNVAQHL